MFGPSRLPFPAGSPTVWLAGVVLVFQVGGCTPPDDPQESIHPRPPNLIAATTTEQGSLDPPNGKSGRSRLLNGWSPTEGGYRVRAGTTASLELAHLGLEPRTLTVDLLRDLPSGDVRIEASGRRLAVRSRPHGLEIEVPGSSSPISSVSITPASDLAVSAIRVQNPRQPGAVSSLDDGKLSQTGWSLHTTAFRAPPGTESCAWSLELQVEVSETSPESRFFVSLPSSSSEWRRVEVDPESGASDRTLEAFLLAGHLLARFEVEGDLTRALWSPTWQKHCPPTEPPTSATTPPPLLDPPPKVVLLYVMDALRADVFDSGLERGSAGPVLTHLAREGALFSAHHSVAPNTLPSTKALLTGKTWLQRGGWKLPDDGPTTLAERFRSAGYRTALFSNNPWVSPTYGVARGFEISRTAPRPDGEAHFRDVERLHDAATAWLSGLEDTAPVFLYLHVLHPHNPYDPPEPYHSAAATPGATIDGSTRALLRVQNRRLEPTPADRRHLRTLYEASFSYAAHQFGELFDWLTERYGQEAVVVALTSDHGEELFDHGGVLHGYTLYEEMVHIPLLIWGPRITARRTEALTSTLDLHAALELLATGGWRPGVGGTLEPLKNRDPHELHLAAAASVKGGIYSVRNAAGSKLIWAPRQARQWGQGARRARSRNVLAHYSLLRDPLEASPRLPEDGPSDSLLLLHLTSWVEQGLGELGGRQPTVSAEVEEALEALGYVDTEH